MFINAKKHGYLINHIIRSRSKISILAERDTEFPSKMEDITSNPEFLESVL